MKKVILTIRHKRDIIGLVRQAAHNDKVKHKHPEFLRKVDEVFRKQYSEATVRTFLELPDELSSKNEGWVHITPSTGSGSFDSINLIFDKEDDSIPMLPSKFVVKSRKDFDELFALFNALQKSADEIESAAQRVVMACKTVDDLERDWPQGRRFWETIVSNAKEQAGAGDAAALIPVSTLKKLNDFCKALAEKP